MFCLKLHSKVQLQFNLSSLIARPCWIKKLQLARSIYEWETKLEHIAQLLELCWRTIQMIAKRLISRDEEIIWARRKAKEIHCCFSGRSTCYLKIETYTPCLFNKLLWTTKNGQTSQGSKNSKREKPIFDTIDAERDISKKQEQDCLKAISVSSLLWHQVH